MTHDRGPSEPVKRAEIFKAVSRAVYGRVQGISQQEADQLTSHILTDMAGQINDGAYPGIVRPQKGGGAKVDFYTIEDIAADISKNRGH